MTPMSIGIPLAPGSFKPSKPVIEYQIGCASPNEDLKIALERIANGPCDKHGERWQIAAVNWKGAYYEIISQRTTWIVLTDEEIAEKKAAEEKARAEHLADLEARGLTAAGINPWGSPYQPRPKPGPSRMEVDMYKGIFAVILGMFPGDSIDMEQRFERFGKIMTQITERLFPEKSPQGPSAALLQAIAEIREGKDDFPEMDLGEE